MSVKIRLKARLRFRWFDMWVGLFWERETRTLYLCPLPMVVISIWREYIVGFDPAVRVNVGVSRFIANCDAVCRSIRDAGRAGHTTDTKERKP